MTVGSRISGPAVPKPTTTAPSRSADAAQSLPAAKPLPGLGKIGAMALQPDQVDTARERKLVALEMVSELEQHPAMTAVVGIVAGEDDGRTELVVASRPNAAKGSSPEGIFEVVERLSSNPEVKDAARERPAEFHSPKKFDAKGLTLELCVPGELTPEQLAKALVGGKQPNQYAQLEELLAGLPKGRRVAICLGGPSAAGKSTLIKKLQELAGDRKVVALTGDMFFRDVNDPKMPHTPDGSLFFDDPAAMHLDEMSDAIAKLVGEGHADLPIYDFAACPDPKNPTARGQRQQGVTPTDLGADDLLVIDSLHAMNPEVIEKLDSLGLPHANIYLDSAVAEDRLVRRIVRDQASRGRSPAETLADWDRSTFPGEVQFVRPTLLEMEPSRDVFMMTQLPTDGALSREQIEQRVDACVGFDAAPTAETFAPPGAPAAPASEPPKASGK